VLLYDSLKKRSIVKNGIFKNGRLKKGSFRISGYDKFFDGTWLSRAWDYQGTSQVGFVPEGTTDTIIGFLGLLDFSTFEPNYTLYFNTSLKVPRIADDAAPWLKNVYEPVYLNRKALRQKEYHDAHLLDNTVSLEQAIRNSEANRNNETQSQGGSKNSSATSQQSTGRDRPCSTCGGKGRVMITDRYGNSASGFCSACNGTGVIHN
jgi:hypothetical protein